MKKRIVSFISLILGLLLLASLAACGDGTDSQPTPSPTGPVSDQRSMALSAGAMKVVNDFADQRQTIDEEWDKFHKDFDTWRAGLTSCERSAVHASLQGFASDFTDVTALAMGLPRASSTRHMADTLIEAAEEEEWAFRQLRDRWQPGNTTLFELVEQQRSDSARAQRSVEDSLAELRNSLESGSGPEEGEALEEFSDSFEDIKGNWIQFHDDYFELARNAGSMETPEILAQIETLISRFSRIVEAVHQLPSQDATESMAEMLQEAARAELEVLLAVRNRLLAGDSIAPTATPRPPETVTTPLPVEVTRIISMDFQQNPDTGTPPSTGSLEGAIPDPPPTAAARPRPGLGLDAMTPIIDKVDALLEQISADIAMLLDEDPEGTLSELDDFDAYFADLLVSWNAFHDGYNDWRRTDGGCDQTQVLQALDRFNLRLGELGRQVRDLPRSSYLQPIHTLLVEALAREEGSIRALRNSWRPFTVDAFKAVDQERLNADRLRRQADIALQELLDRA